jgi:hypothetical protein
MSCTVINSTPTVVTVHQDLILVICLTGHIYLTEESLVISVPQTTPEDSERSIQPGFKPTRKQCNSATV